MFRIGVMVRHSWPIKIAVEYARLAEKIGFHSIWAPSRPFSRNPFITLAAIASQTERVRLGTAVVDVYSRHPVVLASAIASLYELSNGRADLGISPGAAPDLMKRAGIGWNDPVERCRESVTIIKSLVAGESVTFHGKIFSLDDIRLTVQPNHNIRVFVAAESPKMLKMAGEVADGLIATKGPPELTSSQLGQFFDALRKAGRPRWEAEVAMEINLAVGHTAEEAVNMIRPYVAESISLQAPLTFSRLNERTRQVFHHNPQQVPDEIVKQFAVCGTVDDCIDQIKELRKLGVDELFLWYPEFLPNSKFTIDRIKEREFLLETVASELLPKLKAL